MAAVRITIEAHAQYLTPKMVGTFRDQLTKGGEVSVKTRDDGRALKKRNLRKNERQDANKVLDDMLETLSGRITMDKNEPLTNIHYIGRAQMAALAPQRPPGQ